MKPNFRVALLALGLAIGAVPFFAQAQGGILPDPSKQTSPPPQHAQPCEPTAKPVPAPDAGGANGCNSDGEIRPPETGDRGVIKPQDGGKTSPMPVIPPPGTSGGDPNVQPK